jgi:opacity protein-like surface antigen
MRKPLLAMAAVLCSALPVRGQDAPRAELFAGYSFVRSDSRSLNGWNASLAVGVAGSLSLVADASGHYGSAGRRDLSLMAGPGLAFLRGGPVVVFVHALAGLHRESVNIQVFDVSISENDNRFGLLLGGGVDMRAGGKWAVRLQGDYEWSRAQGTSVTGTRLSAGVVYRLGGT